jgi:hypothetical protein
MINLDVYKNNNKIGMTYGGDELLGFDKNEGREIMICRKGDQLYFEDKDMTKIVHKIKIAHIEKK